MFPNVRSTPTPSNSRWIPSRRSSRPGVAVSAGSRLAVGALTLEVGGAAETVEVKAETPLIQATSGERSFTIPTESVQNLPFANRGFTALAQLAPGVTGTSAHGTSASMSTNFTMDGVSTMDTGSNAVMLQINTESIAEVKLLDVRLPGRVRTVERPAGHGGHQERHQPVPRLGLRRRAQLGVELQQQARTI